MENTVNDKRPADATEPYGDAATRHNTAKRAREPESLGALVSDLWHHSTSLVQGEVELAKAEMSEKFTQLLVSIGAIAVGGAVLFAGFIVLLLACVNALVPLLAPDVAAWAAPAIVGLVVTVIGIVMATAGIKALQAHNLTPKRTLESLRRDKEMVKEHV